MTEVTYALEFAEHQQNRYLAELTEFLAIPSVSTLAEHAPDILQAAQWVARQMKDVGFDRVEILPTARHPIVYGEWLKARGKPTILIYGHYDVQPVDPMNEWISPPFEATVRGENLYARGAADMKGKVHAVLKAIEAFFKTTGVLPVNVKMMVEGEEEIGSPSLGAFIDAHRDRLKCDVALNGDTMILAPDQPSLVYGLRGLAYFELWGYGPAQDLHSGVFGGSVHNPAQVLCELVAGMHDEHGRVTLPGFYDKARTLSDEERVELARLPHSDAEWQRITGVPALYGEEGFTTVERLGARPTLEVNGLLSGYTGEGAKTVLPTKAMAKISMRLVPYQDPEEIEAQLREYVALHAPPTVRWEIKKFQSGPAVLVHRDAEGVRAARNALEATFGVKAVFQLEGGSIPVVSMMQENLGVESVLMGFGLPDDNLHSPNEKIHLPTYYRGIAAYIRFLAQF